MYLKELYISGFKSFANPVRLHFDEEVSAIVGPNGSGKSNISDSLRFVLGEQRTKQLRSQKMEDIIFAGTDTQNPRGIAEVNLTLQQEDETDLIIGRKYFRTGESNYFINGRKVRLKDIQTIFNDTGLGKNGYSIVSQGGVENIIGASPLTLRELVEEALGISGIKIKRNETERRLNQTKDNIERIKDILEEIEKQLKPLKRQAKKTRRYLEINDVLKVIDLVSFFDEQTLRNKETERNNQLLENSNKLLSEIEFKSSKLDQSYIVNNNRISELRENVKDLNKDLFHLQETHNNNKSNIVKYESENSYLELEIKRIEENLEKTIKELEELKSSKLDSGSDNEAQLKVIEFKRTVLTEKEKELSHIRELLEKLEQQSKLFETNQTEIKKLEERKLSVQKEQIEIQVNLDHLNQTNEDSLKQITELDNYYSQLSKDLEKDSSSLQELRKQYSQKKEELKIVENKQKLLSKKIDTYRVSYNTLKNQIDYQKSLRNNLSGFQNSVRTVLNYARSNNRKDIIGPVAELFSVDQKYSTAIQVALGNRAQNIVINTEEAAKGYIGYLKKEKKGRATFLPLDALKYSSISENEKQKLLNEEGFIGFASDLLKTKPEYQKVFISLIGRVVIIDNYDNARNFRNRFNKYTIVTLSGETFYPGGAIVGGSTSQDSRFSFFHSIEIDNLTKKINGVIENIKSNDKALKEINQEIETFKNELLLQDHDIQILKQNIFLNKEKINNLLREKNKLVNSENKELYNLNQQKDIAEEQLKEIETKIKRLSRYHFNSEKKGELDKRFQKELSEYTNLKVEVSTLETDYKHKKEKLNNINNKILELNRMKENLSHSKFETIEKIKTNSLRIGELKELLESEKQQIDNSNNLKDKSEVELKKLEDETNVIEENVKLLSQQRLAEVEAKNKVERANDLILAETKNARQYIFNQYGKNYAMIKDEIDILRTQKQDLPEHEVKSLRLEMQKLGSVNTDAINDYTELKNRYENLDNQYNDLLKAEKDILKTIRSINKTIVVKFTDKFDILNKKFDETFSLLFNGGKATLKFTDEKDLLNSGIELSAQPPGKKLKNINLLSGGEKAMTAISLLFSFIELNPAPFTLIDEIDAALDDSNINRFTNYLKKISDRNQFIIITHRKSTLKICDKINGITMASDGISRLCTLELADYVE